jgi:uncharacterized protein (DUF2267 family)
MRRIRGIVEAVMTTQTFYRDVMSTGPERSRELAKRATAAVFHALRDRLTPEEADDLEAQLPIELKEVWAQGEALPRVPTKLDRRAFLERVRVEAGLPLVRDAEWATLAVFAALKNQVSPGEASDVLSQLPKSLEELWIEAQAVA